MASYDNFMDSELIDLVKESDEAAYAEIYNRYAKSLISFAETKLFSLEDARDLIHDLFTSIWSDRYNLRINDNLKAYLFAATRYQIIDKIRKNVVRKEYANKLISMSPAFHSLEEELNGRELDAKIRALLLELPDKTRYIYELSRDNNKSIKEIAEELNLSDQTVKNQISFALKHLRRSFLGFISFFL